MATSGYATQQLAALKKQYEALAKAGQMTPDKEKAFSGQGDVLRSQGADNEAANVLAHGNLYGMETWRANQPAATGAPNTAQALAGAVKTASLGTPAATGTGTPNPLAGLAAAVGAQGAKSAVASGTPNTANTTSAGAWPRGAASALASAVKGVGPVSPAGAGTATTVPPSQTFLPTFPNVGPPKPTTGVPTVTPSGMGTTTIPINPATGTTGWVRLPKATPPAPPTPVVPASVTPTPTPPTPPPPGPTPTPTPPPTPNVPGLTPAITLPTNATITPKAISPQVRAMLDALKAKIEQAPITGQEIQASPEFQAAMTVLEGQRRQATQAMEGNLARRGLLGSSVETSSDVYGLPAIARAQEEGRAAQLANLLNAAYGKRQQDIQNTMQYGNMLSGEDQAAFQKGLAEFGALAPYKYDTVANQLARALQEAGLTGYLNGKSTMARQGMEADLTGNYNGAATLQRALAEAGLTGNYGGQRTIQGQQFDWGKSMDTAGLTGDYNGGRTLAGQQLDLSKLFQTAGATGYLNDKPTMAREELLQQQAEDKAKKDAAKATQDYIGQALAQGDPRKAYDWTVANKDAITGSGADMGEILKSIQYPQGLAEYEQAMKDAQSKPTSTVKSGFDWASLTPDVKNALTAEGWTAEEWDAKPYDWRQSTVGLWKGQEGAVEPQGVDAMRTYRDQMKTMWLQRGSDGYPAYKATDAITLIQASRDDLKKVNGLSDADIQGLIDYANQLWGVKPGGKK